uniref:NADH-ubiquinone oxidoreductase chain 2 n=1 Tax=Vespa affinis TaxID=882735 RepID=A0A348AZ56_VESAF|nr:NADH dehydrogenase subunit 2 [Vespa affinis]BBD17833.1 NADH dehydrogenase subunit 2 [Vespa affinis]
MHKSQHPSLPNHLQSYKYPYNMNLNKLFYFMVFIMTLIPLLSIFFTNFIHLWIMMEMNTIIMISAMAIFMKSFKSTLNFFIIQSFSSLMLIYLMMMTNGNSNNLPYSTINMILMIAFSLKLGLFPFHFWPPLINQNINWILILIMSTSQKFIPMVIFHSFIDQKNNTTMLYIMLTISLMSSLMSTLMNIFETNLMKIMTFSSMNHLSWMMMIIIFDYSMFMIYFATYTMAMIPLSLAFNKFNMISIFSLSKTQLLNFKAINFLMSVNLLIVSTIPPFITFLMKINLLKILIDNYSTLSSFLLSMASIFTLIFYMNIIIKINTFNLMKIKFYKPSLSNLKFNFSSMILISIMVLFFVFFSFYFM